MLLGSAGASWSAEGSALRSDGLYNNVIFRITPFAILRHHRRGEQNRTGEGSEESTHA